jgi:hypothetical protein
MKALCVFSGGLDSLLAAELVKRQGIELTAVFFETPFFRADKAAAAAERLSIPFKVVDITSRHLAIVMNPPHGYGANMNPCVDCHALMLKTAGRMLEVENASFVVTGEVLGQRPFSQTRSSLKTVAAESGIEDLIVRPLSAKRLPPSMPEREGWIRRENLYDLMGRSRKPQMELARQLGITDYQSPAGGCLLTDKFYSLRLKDLLAHRGDALSLAELELLRVGRHLRLKPDVKVIVGRNQRENEEIIRLAGEGGIIMTSESFPGPTVLVSGLPSEEDLLRTASITLSYSDAPEGTISLVIAEEKGRRRLFSATALPRSAFQEIII